MIYQDKVTGEREAIWNSRDGVTPFCLSSRAGNPAEHVSWSSDRCVPDHTPALGDRVFVDLTRERAIELRTRFVEKWWDQDAHGYRMSGQWPTKEAAIEELAQTDLETGGGGAPDLIEVNEAFLAQLRDHRTNANAGLKAVVDQLQAQQSAAILEKLQRMTVRAVPPGLLDQLSITCEQPPGDCDCPGCSEMRRRARGGR
jgi:hypothetical protein